MRGALNKPTLQHGPAPPPATDFFSHDKVTNKTHIKDKQTLNAQTCKVFYRYLYTGDNIFDGT